MTIATPGLLVAGGVSVVAFVELLSVALGVLAGAVAVESDAPPDFFCELAYASLYNHRPLTQKRFGSSIFSWCAWRDNADKSPAVDR